MKYRSSVVVVALFVALLGVMGSGGRAFAFQAAEFGDGGFLNIEYQVQARAALRDQGPDPSQDQKTRDLYMRRNRLSFLGALNEAIGFAAQFEYNGGRQIGSMSVSEGQGDYEWTFRDYYLTWYPTDYVRFRAGKTKHVLTREVSEGCYDPLSIDRSDFILGPFAGTRGEKTTRDYGLVVWGNLFEEKFQYRFAAMKGNNFGENKPDDIGYRYTGRVHLSLLEPEANLGYKGTYLGKKKVLTLGAGYETQPDAVFSPSGTGAEDYKAVTYDFFYENPTDMGTFTLSGAFLETDFNDAGLNGVGDAQGAGGERNGSYWKAGYMIGKIQVFGRYEDWSFASLEGVPGQTITLTTGGVNYYIKGQDVRLTAEYAATDLEKEDASHKDFTTILAQLQLRF